MAILYVGERNYSSWSLRPWLVLRWSGLDFQTRFVSLDQPGYGEAGVEAIRAVSPTGKVPALLVDGIVIWDSLAIGEWVAEQVPEACLWPADRRMRTHARAVVCEMHSGFQALRRDLPMNIRRRIREQTWADDTRRDIARMEAIWDECRRRYGTGGPYLFGQRTIADAFFTPVAARMRTYSVALAAEAAAYRDTVLADQAFLEWEKLALSEWKAPFSRAAIDAIYPGADL